MKNMYTWAPKWRLMMITLNTFNVIWKENSFIVIQVNCCRYWVWKNSYYYALSCLEGSDRIFSRKKTTMQIEYLSWQVWISRIPSYMDGNEWQLSWVTPSDIETTYEVKITLFLFNYHKPRGPELFVVYDSSATIYLSSHKSRQQSR